VKYEVRKAASWGTFAVAPGPKGGPVKVVDATDLKDADGKPLPADVVQLLVRRQVLVPLTAAPE
jgi:hypothetical protein